MAKTVFLVLCGLALAAHALEISRGHPFPLYDEVEYLNLARDFHAKGPVGTIGCYAAGECREDNRHPLYMLKLSPWMDGGPEDFTRGKFISLLMMLALVVFLFFAVRRSFGEAAGWCAAALAALSPSLAAVGQNVSADGLFALLYVAALWVLVEFREKLWGWAVFGLIAGWAYLAKGNGHFLLLAGFALVPSPRPSAGPLPWGEGIRRAGMMLGGFIAGSWFLLLRNVRVFGSPFYNINGKEIWTDNVREFYMMSPFPEWDRVGLRWFIERHGVSGLFTRTLYGALDCAPKLVKAMAAGPASLWATFGLLVLGMAVGGLLLAWRRGQSAYIVATLLPAAVLFAAFSFGAPPFGANLRYFMPIAVSLLPFAALELAQLAQGHERTLKAGLVLACVVLLWVHRRGLGPDPRSLWAVTPEWAQTSKWIHSHVDANGYLADPATIYSDWDEGRVNRTLFPFDAPKEDIEKLLAQRGIKYVLIDGMTKARPDIAFKTCFSAGQFEILCR